MLKVNEKKILSDYNELKEKRKKNLANLETQVRAFALSLGYDEEKTQGLISFVQNQNGNGLSEKDMTLLEILSSYIDEVEEVVEQVPESEDVQFTTELPKDVFWNDKQ